MRVFISSCDTGEGIPGALQGKVEKLRHLYEMSDKTHTLVGDPESADIILVVFVREDPGAKKFLQHNLINKYPGRCFSISDADHPLILHHGIYASGTKSLPATSRVRSGSFTSYNDEFLNPYVQAHVPPPKDSAAKRFLLSFVGRDCCELRTRIFRLKFERPDIFIENSSSFDLWHGQAAGRSERQKHYYDVLVSSKFSLCPRGDGASSLRLFESMQVGVAPVIISDGWIFPKGPRWHDFSIILKQKHLGELEKIVEAHETSYAEMGSRAREAFDTYFAKNLYFEYIVASCVDIMRTQWMPEAFYWKLSPAILAFRKAKARIFHLARRALVRLAWT
jgi:hypothetical protein